MLQCLAKMTTTINIKPATHQDVSIESDGMQYTDISHQLQLCCGN